MTMEARIAEHDALALPTIRHARAAGMSWEAAAAALDEAGIPPPGRRARGYRRGRWSGNAALRIWRRALAGPRRRERVCRSCGRPFDQEEAEG